MLRNSITRLIVFAAAIISPAATNAADQTATPSPSAAVIESLDPVAVQHLAYEVLDRNPGLRTMQFKAAAAEARIPQVRSLPDPMAGLTAFVQSPETRVGPQQLGVMLSQRIPWFGKLDLREQAAMWMAMGARADVESRKLALIEETSRLFYELAFLDRWAEIVQSDRATLVLYEELTRTRYAAGIGTSQAPIKIQAEITKDDNRLIEIGKRRAQVLASLNALRDMPDNAPVEGTSIPRSGSLPVLPDAWLERAVEARPELVRAQAEIERANTGIELAKKDYMPDVTFGLGYTLVGSRDDAAGIAMPPPDNGQDVIALTAGVNIPIWRERLAAGVDEAARLREAAESAKTAQIAAIRQQLDDLAQRLPLTAQQIALFEDILVRQAEQSLLSAEAGYAAGNLGALDLLDAQRVLLDVRTSMARARADYAISAARLATSTASPLDVPIGKSLTEGNE